MNIIDGSIKLFQIKRCNTYGLKIMYNQVVFTDRRAKNCITFDENHLVNGYILSCKVWNFSFEATLREILNWQFLIHIFFNFM